MIFYVKEIYDEQFSFARKFVFGHIWSKKRGLSQEWKAILSGKVSEHIVHSSGGTVFIILQIFFVVSGKNVYNQLTVENKLSRATFKAHKLFLLPSLNQELSPDLIQPINEDFFWKLEKYYRILLNFSVKRLNQSHTSRNISLMIGDLDHDCKDNKLNQWFGVTDLLANGLTF